MNENWSLCDEAGKPAAGCDETVEQPKPVKKPAKKRV